MNFLCKTLTMAGLLCAALGGAPAPAIAQQAPDTPPAAAPPKPKGSAQADAGEPRANTSEPSAPGVATPAPAAPPAAAKPAPAAQPKGKPTNGTPKPAGSADRLDLGTATVTGDREQPKVMYIVPWKSSTMGDLAGKPMNSLVDEILAPVDRDVFKREVTYYQAVQSDASQNGASAKPSPRGEK